MGVRKGIKFGESTNSDNLINAIKGNNTFGGRRSPRSYSVTRAEVSRVQARVKHKWYPKMGYSTNSGNLTNARKGHKTLDGIKRPRSYSVTRAEVS